ETGRDVFEHVLCGASAVQIGTALVEENVSVFERLEGELKQWLQRKGYSSLMACRGKLKEL
ncbi:MAG: dihydroorotate oxidase, partial [Nitrospirota bacterium]